MYKFPKYIDTHVHIHHEMYENDEIRIIEDALKEGVWVILVGTDLCSSVEAVNIAKHYDYGVYAAVGIHPNKIFETYKTDFTNDPDEIMSVGAFRSLVLHPKVVAIGEVGLNFENDYFTNSDSELDAEMLSYLQTNIFKNFLNIALDHKLPLILSISGAHDDFFDLLDNHEHHALQNGYLKGIIHHFTLPAHKAGRFIKSNIIPSVTSLFTHQTHQLNFLKGMPLDKVMIESECVFMCENGGFSRPEPAHLPQTCASIARLRGLETDEFRREITKNTLKMFSGILRNLP